MSILAEKPERLCIVQDRFDQAAYREMLEQSEKLKSLVDEGGAGLNTFPDLMNDIFAALYKVAPELRDITRVADAHAYHHGLLERMIGLREYEELRAYTRMDEVGAAIGCCSLGQTVLKEIDQETKDAINQTDQTSQESEQLQDQLAALNDLQGTAQDHGQPGAAQDLAKMIKETSKRRTKAQAAARKAAEIIQQKLATQGNMLRQIVRKGTQQALDEAKETMESLSAWGSEPGQVQKLDYKERFRMAQIVRNSPKLQQIAKFAGRFKQLALTKQKTKFNTARDEVYSVGLGSDLSRILPSELVLISKPATKPVFYKKLLEGKLLSYELKGKERLGKGPIIVCEDQSGSMNGDKEIWAKAVSLALLDIANLQKRDFAHVAFASKGKSLTTFCPKGKCEPFTAIALAEYFFGGGTDFETALTEVRGILSRDEFKKGDVIFVTDGQCKVSDEFLEEFLQSKEEKETVIYGILIEGSDADREGLTKFCDQVIPVQNFLQESQTVAENLFSAI